jgi:hypothetical protein
LIGVHDISLWRFRALYQKMSDQVETTTPNTGDATTMAPENIGRAAVSETARNYPAVSSVPVAA